MDTIELYIIDIDCEKHTINVSCNSELNLMDVLREAGFSMGNCGGMALCASCHCYIQEFNNLSKISSKTEAEEDMLDQLHNSDITKSRLICQIPLVEELNGITLKIVKN